MFCAYTASSGQAGLSTTYWVETPMKLVPTIRPTTRLRPGGTVPASSAWVRVIFSGRMPTRTFPPFAVGAVHRAAGRVSSHPPLPETVRFSPSVRRISVSMRLEVPRKFATNVVRGFS